MDRISMFGWVAVASEIASFLAMNFLPCTDELQVALVASHLVAVAVGAWVGSQLLWPRRWLGLVVLGPSLAFLGLQVAWLYQCCR